MSDNRYKGGHKEPHYTLRDKIDTLERKLEEQSRDTNQILVILRGDGGLNKGAIEIIRDLSERIEDIEDFKEKIKEKSSGIILGASTVGIITGIFSSKIVDLIKKLGSIFN